MVASRPACILPVATGLTRGYIASRLRCDAYRVHAAWRWRYQTARPPWILGRVACLGQDVLRLLGLDDRVLNFQKARADYWPAVARRPELRPSAGQVARFLRRRDVLTLIAQQSDLPWHSASSPAAIVMDSFAELTDQLFIERMAGWRFCANYSDLDHSEGFGRRFVAAGLLATQTLDEVYREFFGFIRERFGQAPVVYLHFPAKLDHRALFRDRHARILETVDTVGRAFPPFYSLAVDDAVVDWPERSIAADEELFPYHYNHATYQSFVDQIRATRSLDSLMQHDAAVHQIEHASGV